MQVFTVLHIEDDIDLANEFQKLIKDYPFLEFVGHSATEEEGLNLLAKLRPDILVCDLALGEDDGLVLLKKLKTSIIPWPHYVIATSAYASHAEISNALALMEVYPLTKGTDYSSRKVLNHLQVLFFDKMHMIETKEQKIRKLVHEFIKQFNLEHTPIERTLIVEKTLIEIVLNQPQNKKIVMTEIKDNLKTQYPDQNFHSMNSDRFIEAVFEYTSKDKLISIAEDFHTQPTEHTFFTIATEEIRKLLSN